MAKAHTMIRDYPAYGRTIAAHIARGQRPIVVGVLLSSNWRYFDHVPKIGLRPDEWARGRFEFGYLRDMHVVAVPGDDCTNEQLGELLYDLMRAGPARLWAYNVDGSKLSDDDWPTTIAHWVHQLTRGDIPYGLAKPAAGCMEAAQRRALDREKVEFERAGRRSEEEAIRVYLRAYERQDQVRALFSSPWQASDARAA